MRYWFHIQSAILSMISFRFFHHNLQKQNIMGYSDILTWNTSITEHNSIWQNTCLVPWPWFNMAQMTWWHVMTSILEDIPTEHEYNNGILSKTWLEKSRLFFCLHLLNSAMIFHYPNHVLCDLHGHHALHYLKATTAYVDWICSTITNYLHILPFTSGIIIIGGCTTKGGIWFMLDIQQITILLMKACALWLSCINYAIILSISTRTTPIHSKDYTLDWRFFDGDVLWESYV
jgi:hypothetical protein